MARNILIKPMLTEKSDKGMKKGEYTFVVDRKANKLEIQGAVEAMFNVSVSRVNTSVTPSKVKSRNTRSGVVKGRVSSYKKAYVLLAEGEKIELFGAAEE